VPHHFDMRGLLALVLLSGCVINNHPKQVYGPPSPPKKAEAPKTITLVCNETCNDTEKMKLPELERKLNATLNSDCFAKFILAKGRKWTELRGDDPLDVLLKMRTEQVIMVSYFYHFIYGLQGFEVAGQPVVHINRNALAAYNQSFCSEASIMAHEIAHAKGLMHRGNENNDHNYYSPPYQINHAFDSLDEDYRNGGCCI
jgi:hypothetical protein